MKNINARLALSAIVVATLTACASRPAEPPAELLSATSAVQRAQALPQVSQHAPLELQRATDTLARANRQLADKAPLAEVASTAYVAERQAETAIELARAKTSEDGLRTAEAQRERVRADARQREAMQAQTMAAAARSEADAALATAQQAQAQAAAIARQKEALQQQTAELKQATEQLRQELAARQTERGMLVTLGDVLFEFGRAEIKPSARDSLSQLATFLRENPERHVLIEGFTDSIGSDSVNQQLSERRAEAVAQALVGMGVARERITSAGYGKSYPIADNSSDSNRALNRRVEVYISQDGEPVQPRRG